MEAAQPERAGNLDAPPYWRIDARQGDLQLVSGGQQLRGHRDIVTPSVPKRRSSPPFACVLKTPPGLRCMPPSFTTIRSSILASAFSRPANSAALSLRSSNGESGVALADVNVTLRHGVFKTELACQNDFVGGNRNAREMVHPGGRFQNVLSRVRGCCPGFSQNTLLRAWRNPGKAV